MAMFDVFSISGSAMNAQSVRLNAIASNLANADSVSGDPNQVYKSKKAVFATMLKNAGNKQSVMGVQVTGIFESKAAPIIRPDSNHPLADAKGNVYMPNINTVEEMADMMSASRAYQNNVEVFNTSKQLLLRTLNMGSQ